MIPELTAVLDDVEKWIWLNDRGVLVIDSRLRKLIGAENEQLLISCVEDYTDEGIDYASVVRDFTQAWNARKMEKENAPLVDNPRR